LKKLGAVFGQKFGWERANFFATDGAKQEDDWSFRRSNWFKSVEKECKNVKENVGLLDMTAFAKCRIKGPKVEEFLDKLVANKLPKKIGRINLCHALNTKGGVHSEFTIMKESENSFYLVSAGAFQRLDHDWIYKWMPKDGSVQFENLTNSIGVLVVSGPKARELMQRVSKVDFSSEKFKWLSAQNINIGLAPCNAMRVNFVGELGWELHHPIEYQNHIFDKLMETGKNLNLKPYGIRAMNSLRVEKSYKLVGTELSIEYSPYESGLDRFVHPNKGDFIGLEALNRWREKGFSNKLVTMEVHGATDADVLGNNPIYSDGKVVGRATGGDFGFRLNKSLALGMAKPELAKVGQDLEIDILGKIHKASIIEESPYDPENKLLKA
jgi:dimethylglycine dehydrogenase